MPKRFSELTWRPYQGGMWRKRYKGRDYYFPRKKDETKEASYYRCLHLWTEKKAEIEQTEIESNPNRQAWLAMIDKATRFMEKMQQTDSPESRQWWNLAAGLRTTYQVFLDRNEDFPGGPDTLKDPSDPDAFPLFLITTDGVIPPDSPPWEREVEESVGSDALHEHIDRFLKRQARRVKEQEISHGRYEVLRVGLEDFAKVAGSNRHIGKIDAKVLNRYRDWVEQRIDAQEFSRHTGRDRLAVVKQFVRWAAHEELLVKPSLVDSRQYTIAVTRKKIETFTSDEIERLLRLSSEQTRLYLLLMLNCGMYQGDIANLRQDEIDLKQGRITRKRSKTKHHGDKVPTVCYQLWPETLRLLKQHRSKHKTLALTNAKGETLLSEEIVNGRVKKIDNIRSAFRRVLDKHNRAHPDAKIELTLKHLRKTAATKLGSHEVYGRYAQYFLGHAPSNVADTSYVLPSQEQFDAAIQWLGEQFSHTGKGCQAQNK